MFKISKLLRKSDTHVAAAPPIVWPPFTWGEVWSIIFFNEPKGYVNDEKPTQ